MKTNSILLVTSCDYSGFCVTTLDWRAPYHLSYCIYVASGIIKICEETFPWFCNVIEPNEDLDVNDC